MMGYQSAQFSTFQRLWNAHNGTAPFFPSAGDHQCAINMSVALQQVDIDMSDYYGKSSYFYSRFHWKRFKLAWDVNQLSHWVLNNVRKIIPPQDYLGQATFNNNNWTHKRLVDSYIPPYSNEGDDYKAENYFCSREVH